MQRRYLLFVYIVNLEILLLDSHFTDVVQPQNVFKLGYKTGVGFGVAVYCFLEW